MSIVNYSLLIGVGSVLGIWVIYAALSGKWNPLVLVEGADGRLSTSKFQWWIWVWTLVFTYITFYAARSLAQHAAAAPLSDIPENVLAILGFSTGTVTIAKGVTQSYVASGAVAKSQAKTSSAADLVVDDGGTPDPYKLQIFIWTLIAVGIYIALLVGVVTKAAASANVNAALAVLTFPDVDSSLMLLSGLSATGYLGKKIVTKDAPKITSVTPSQGRAGQALSLVVLGDNFGREQGKNDKGENVSRLNIGPIVDLQPTYWTDVEIRAAAPATLAKGTHNISVIVAGVKSNVLPIELV